MDYTIIEASVATGIAGIAAISAFLNKYVPKIIGYIQLAKDAVETISDMAEIVKPDADGVVRVTADEIKKMGDDATAFQAQLKTLQGK